MTNKCVIFDFAGTLCSEPYFKTLPMDSLDAVEKLVFRGSSSEWADPWMRGELSYQDIAQYLSLNISESADVIISALKEGCAEMSFNYGVYAFALSLQKSGIKAALVTLNMDIFSEVVVPAHNLAETFDVIVNSSDHGTVDKCELWDYAFNELECSYEDSLLIDDSAEWCEAFQKKGGTAHQYINDKNLMCEINKTF